MLKAMSQWLPGRGGELIENRQEESVGRMKCYLPCTCSSEKLIRLHSRYLRFLLCMHIYTSIKKILFFFFGKKRMCVPP